ncbi:uncharacterized protein LOC132949925 [Metopolophium dirhodum]|uniref:uncharacterized protein LOC132949925 n=1 Tax=Metopolophium dirhodum TaxID=44670 RepID=UPI00298F6095|nr:uncharacterized protein LOC132949925 [Metopolophium dirhodum]
MVKPTKVMGTNCMIRESLLKCINSCKQLKLQKIKSKNDKIRLLKTKMSVLNVQKRIKNYEAGENEKSCNYKPVDLSKRIIANKKVKHCKIKTNEQFQCPNNMEPEKKTKKIPSKIFSRKFSKYKDVQQKLKAKFKSNYNSSGKFDQSSTKYKAYVNKNKNKKNKSFLKYSMCSFGFNRKILKKKRTVCPELPGKGTYNHRFAYDDALQLQRKGIEVDVLYKVKNKTDSIYVINGEFLWTKNKRSSKKPKAVINTADKIRQEQKLTESLISLSLQEKAELAKMLKENAQKKRLAKMVLLQKAEVEREKKLRLDEFIRKRDLENIEKDLRAKELSKTEKLLKKKAKDEKRNQKEMEIDIAKYNAEMEKLRRLKLQQNIASINNNNDDMNTTHNEQVINQKNGYDGLKVITDSNIINDIGRWALQNDGIFNMSWLKIVARRIDSLDGRVDTIFKNKWMQIAIDKVVDVMTEKKLMSDFYKKDLSHRKLLCNKSVQVSPSFVIKNKRMMKCHKRHTSISIRKSPKFSGCPGDGQGVRKLHKVIKTEGSYFQVISVDAFGSYWCKEWMN